MPYEKVTYYCLECNNGTDFALSGSSLLVSPLNELKKLVTCINKTIIHLLYSYMVPELSPTLWDLIRAKDSYEC